MSYDEHYISELISALCEERATAQQIAELDRLLCTDEEARRLYLKYMDLHARLACLFHKPAVASPFAVPVDDTLPWSMPAEAVEKLPPLTFSVEDAPANVGSNLQQPAPTVSMLPDYELPWEKPRPKVVIETSPPSPIPWYSVNSPIGLPLISYTLGAIITLIAIGIGAVVQITHSYEVAARQAATSEKDSGSGGGGVSGAVAAVEKAEPKKAKAKKQEEAPVVGYISGMADCRWADPSLKPVAPRVRQGTKFALASGLMEITYSSGAKVILQGPCTYEIESPHGGYLSLGKLTARVEPPKSDSSNPAERSRQAFQKRKLSSEKSLFAVRTPTAIITDLGTEFGVEVDEERNTISHVFQGRIEVRFAGDVSGNESHVVVLSANQSARVECGSKQEKPRLIKLDELESATYSAKFARRLREPPKFLDLLDIVAGGDGLGNRRERGIDQNTGRMCSEFHSEYLHGACQYLPVWRHPFIDGVFVPSGRCPSTQLDSAGNAFNGFPPNNGATFGLIWVRSVEVLPEMRNKGWIFEVNNAHRFMPQGRGLLAFHANVGITLDLAAIRKAYPALRLERLRAVAGLADPRPFSSSADGTADLHIFLDGRLKWQKLVMRQEDEPLALSVTLEEQTRFLTIVASDAGDGIRDDCLVLGDVVLEVSPLMEEQGPGSKRPDFKTK